MNVTVHSKPSTFSLFSYKIFADRLPFLIYEFLISKKWFHWKNVKENLCYFRTIVARNKWILASFKLSFVVQYHNFSKPKITACNEIWCAKTSCKMRVIKLCRCAIRDWKPPELDPSLKIWKRVDLNDSSSFATLLAKASHVIPVISCFDLPLGKVQLADFHPRNSLLLSNRRDRRVKTSKCFWNVSNL